MTAWFEPLFQILWYSQLPCFDVKRITSLYNGQKGLLQKCQWKGVTIPCSAIFQTYPTDQGMCCAFNMKKANEIFRNGNCSDIITKMQDTDLNNTFGQNKPPNKYTRNKEPNPAPGQHKGLTVMLDARTNWISAGSISEDIRGFTAYVDAGDNFPLTMQKGIKIRPGHENNVAIRAFDVQTSDDTISIEANKRGCLFETEHTLKLYNRYTQVSVEI